MAIHYPPPPPFLGAQQPHAPRQLAPAIAAVQVDNPPTSLGGPLAIPASIVAANQPDWSTKAWPYVFIGRQPYEPRKLAPAIPGQSVDNPPFTYGGPLALKHELAWLSQPDPWTFNYAGGLAPFLPRKLSPGVPGQAIDRPPTRLGGPVAIPASIIAANQPDWSTKAWPYVFIGRSQPYAPRVAAPRLISVAVDNPPFSSFGRTPAMVAIAQAWVPPFPTFQLTLYASRPTPQRLRPTARGYVIL